MAETYTFAATFTYTRSELITDLVSGAFDLVLERLGADDSVPSDSLEEVLSRGWLDSISVVATSMRADGSHDWHMALRAEIDAETHLARLAVTAERTIDLPKERADDIADQLSYYGQMFVKLVERHALPSWQYGLWWTPSVLGMEHEDEFHAITGTKPVDVHRAPRETIGNFSPDEVDEANFGIEVYGSAQ